MPDLKFIDEMSSKLRLPASARSTSGRSWSVSSWEASNVLHVQIWKATASSHYCQLRPCRMTWSSKTKHSVFMYFDS